MRELYERLAAEVGKVVVGQDDVLRGVVIGLAVGGHVLLEGPPGVAKTLLASAVARSLGLEFRRVQFTPDMLPSDLTGTSTLRAGELAFRSGPVFTNLLLADEINRTPPKTQAALLEAMQEGQVSADGESRPLPDPFVVVATQNPIEYEGTYPLPEAQLDRFMVRVSLGYPSAQDEKDMLADHSNHDRVFDLEPVTGVGEVLAAQAAVASVHGSDALRRYIVAILDATREDPRTELGASPRAGLLLFRAAKVLAALEGRDHALPDDVKALAPSVLPHRLLLAPEAAGDDREAVVRDALDQVPAL